MQHEQIFMKGLPCATFFYYCDKYLQRKGVIIFFKKMVANFYL